MESLCGERLVTKAEQTPRAGWRTRVGLALFLVSLGWPVLIPVLLLLGFSAKVTAAFSGTMVVLAELLLIAGAAIAGKEGFAFIKAGVFGFLKRYGPPQRVSRRRYRVGLVLFVLPIVFGGVAPYLGHHLPGFETREWVYAFAFDVMLLISLFVLGGHFWDKLRALFYYDGLPQRTTETEAEPSEPEAKR